MKKLLFFVILCLLISGQIFAQTRISVSSGKNQLELTQNSRDGFSVQNSIAYFDIQLEKMFTQGEYVVLNVDGYGTSFNIGNPDLHVLNRLIEVPLGATVEVKIISYDEMVFNLSDYDINKQLFPAQESVSKSSDPTTIVLQKNITAYETDKWFSNPLARFHEEGIMRGVRFGRLEISPFAYNPVAGELKVYNNLKVEVKFLKSDFARTESVKKQYYTPAFNGLFSGMLNYDSNLTREDLTFNSIPMHFVIISHRMFEQTLAPFIAWKKKQGFLVTLRYTDEAEVGTTTTSIKNYLQGLYANASPTAPAPAFIALVGDVAQVPTYVGMAPPNTPHPTDLYYTTYDGASDIIPDVFIGRMSAQNVAQLEAILYKTLIYEQFQMTDPTYLTRSLTIAGFDSSWAPLYGNGALNYMSQYLNAAHGIDPLALYHPCNTQQTAVLNRLNQGVGIGVYTAHCSETLWDSPRVDTGHIKALTNSQKWGLLIGNCCLSAKFDVSQCFGEAVIRAVDKGGIGYIGGSESTYWDEDYWWATGFGTVVLNPTISSTGVGSFDALFHENGEPETRHAITGSQLNMAGCLAVNESNSSRKKYYWEIYHFLGDPTVMPYIGTMPPMNPSYMTALPLGLNTLSVTDLAPNSYVALTDNGVLKAAGFADNNGAIDLEFETFAMPTTADLVATTTFYQPYFGTVEIVPAQGPYVVCQGYTPANEEKLTYISTNSEIEVTLKNVGLDPSGANLTATITCDDPSLTINTGTVTCGSIAPDATATVKFTVTVAHDIPDNKVFPATVTVNDGQTSWTSPLSLKAYAPDFSLDKVLVNGVEGGSLSAGAVVTLTAVVKNKGGADAYTVKGSIEINSQYVTLACPDIILPCQNLPAGDSMELPFTVITDPTMPYGHEADNNLLLTANYGISSTKNFKATYAGANAYCTPATTSCNSDKFTIVKLTKMSDQSVILNNTNNTCTSGGYQNYLSTVVPLVQGEEYKITVKVSYAGDIVKGWFDLNGNNAFEASEGLINITCPTTSQEYSQIFTVPHTALPGSSRFRIRLQDGGTPEPCNGYSYGQTHDYTITLPEIYPHVKNVAAQLSGSNITVTWEAPEGDAPDGYNIYRFGNLLNETPLTETTFTDENITEGVYVYSVTSVFAPNESLPEMSNVLCITLTCEIPEALSGVAIDEEKSAVLTWNEPRSLTSLLGYNIYRNEVKLNETPIAAKQYRDEELANGTYTYKVSAVYELMCEESDLTDGVEVTINYMGIHDAGTTSYKLFPNPTNRNVTIEGNGLARVEIYDIQGRHLADYNCVNGKLQMNVNNYENGIYFVRLLSDTGEVSVKRLVVIK